MSLELFRTLSPPTGPLLSPPQWPFIQRGLQKNLEKVQTYYRQAAIGVRSDHLLVRLLQALSVPKTLPLERYHAHVEAVSLNLAMTFNLTTVQSKGRLHRGIFYGPRMPELLLVTEDYFDAEAVHMQWEHVSAVTPLLHPKSDLGFQIPNGKAYSDEYGLSVILINLPMLAVQYRAFYLEELKKPEEVSRRTIMQFIGAYVLPNMLAQSIELCLFNRLNRLFFRILNQDNQPRLRHPFALMEYTSHLDKALLSVLDYAQKEPKRFETLLQAWPAIGSKCLYSALRMPDIAPTRQIDWVLVLSRLKALNLLIELSGTAARALNQHHLNQALRALTMYDTYALFKEMLPDDVFFEAQAYVENLLDATQRNSFK